MKPLQGFESRGPISLNRSADDRMQYQTLCIFLLSSLLPAGLSAQGDSAAAGMLTSRVEELLAGSSGDVIESGTRTDLADHNDQEVREAPGVLYVLTAEDIKNANCRDLEEALMLLPGFSAGRDVDDVVGFGIRGQWAHEGKCLYQLNGMPLNESSYGIFAMGARFPLDNISRIEVINGPGSVIHGGFAAMGTVNIVTKDLRDEEGLIFSTSTGVSNETPLMQRGHLYGAHRIGSATEISYGTSLTMGPRFVRKEADLTGLLTNYADSTRTQTLNAFFSIRRKNFRGQFFASDYNMQVSDMPYDLVMRTVMASGEQRIGISKNARLDISLLARLQLPWFYANGASYALNQTNTVDQRTQANAALSAKPKEWLNVMIGIQAWLDRFKLYATHEGNVFNVNGKDRLAILDAAVFGEVRAKSKFGSLIAGARAEHHSLTGTAGAPRFGYTAIFGKLHVKLLYSAAFKVPTMQNINVGPVEGIRREQVWTREAEVGVRFSKNTEIGLVAFHTLITDPIVYAYLGDSAVQDSYLNRMSSATQGLEGTFSHSGHKAGVRLAVSYYEVDRAATDLPETQLPDSLDPAFQALPQLKATFVGFVCPSDHDRIGVHAIWSGRSYGYHLASVESDEVVLQASPASLRAGVFAERSFRRIEGLSVAIGCNNILDQRTWIQSPYNNGLTPLPMNGREFTFRIDYRFAL